MIRVKLDLNLNHYAAIIDTSVGTYNKRVYVQFIYIFNNSCIVLKLFYKVLINAGSMVLVNSIMCIVLHK